MAKNLTVMVVDHSARAHAVAEAYLGFSNKVIVTSGNELIAHLYQQEVVLAKRASHKNPQSVLAAAQEFKPDWIDVCQDDALALGTVDLLQENGFSAFGPTKAAARIEWDKHWSRDFMRRHNIPHPEYVVCTDEEYGISFVRGLYANTPDKLMFVKANGLAAGKGVIPARNLEEAIAAVRAMKSFGEAGSTYLIEEGMVGEEASLYAISDGTNFYVTRSAQDHKARDNFDLGPNTGGMGAVAPCRLIADNRDLEQAIRDEIIKPAILGLKKEGIPYVGVLYVSVMAVKENGRLRPKVVEFNARWGAPEAEVIVPGIITPMHQIVNSCLTGQIGAIAEDNKVRVCFVGASRGYPDSEAVKAVTANGGKRIYGLEDAMHRYGVKVYGAGISVRDDKLYTSGGRLFSLVAEGTNIIDARAKALEAMSLISVEGNNLQYRNDIGWRDVERLTSGK